MSEEILQSSVTTSLAKEETDCLMHNSHMNFKVAFPILLADFSAIS